MAETGLVTACLLNGQGGARQMDWEMISRWVPEDGVLWVHLNRDSTDSQDWLRESSGLTPLVVESLLAESTRPRCAQMDEGIMLFLRGVNLNPGADPEDTVSIRLWIEASRIISVRIRRLLSIDDLREELEKNRGPKDVGDFVVQLAERLISRMSGVIGDVDDEVDRLQDQVLVAESRELRTELTRLRREIIALRRYLAPQRDALLRLSQLKIPWLNEMDTLHLREETDRVTRYVEELDAARERATLTQDADTGGQTLYVVDLARALAERDDVHQVDLVTRRVTDSAVSNDYAKPV